MSEPKAKSSRTKGESAERTYASMVERQRLQALVGVSTHPASVSARAAGELWYILDRRSRAGGRTFGSRARPGCIPFTLALRRRDPLTGSVGKLSQLDKLSEVAPDTPAESLVCALARADAYSVAWLDARSCRELLPALCETGRVAQLSDALPEPEALTWDGGDPWQLELQAERMHAEPETALLRGVLSRDEVGGVRELAVSKLEVALPPDLFVCEARIHCVRTGLGRWLIELRQKPLAVADSDAGWFVRQLSRKPFAPQVRNLSLFGFALDAAKVKPLLRVQLPKKAQRLVRGELLFRYGERVYGADPEQIVALRQERKDRGAEVLILRRDYESETRSVARLQRAGFEVELGQVAPPVAFSVRVELDQFVRAVDGLVFDGFRVEAEGQAFRRATAFSPVIDSEQDWFCLKGDASFDGETVELPALLEAVRKKARWVRLGDGSFGILPEEWLASLTTLARVTTAADGSLRFHESQSLLLDAATAGLPGLSWNSEFDRIRGRLSSFDGVNALPEPEGFSGTLRAYQRHALGWLAALDDLGFGGCLADDMGLGKTVVVAAWLLRRVKSGRTSLVVVPRTLLFNWEAELARFAPALSVKLHHGSGRGEVSAKLYGFDAVLTSYGTLRSDSKALASLNFDYVVLDEAHRIKNRGSETYRAACALQSHSRLALTGTPLENNIGEVWSLLSYLNPELFRNQNHLQKVFERKRPSDVAVEQVIRQAVRPFVLRRTKAQVAPELPPRVEKTLLVRLSKAERRKYDELATFFRGRIIEDRKIRRKFGAGGGLSPGNGQGAAQALEALLRLRQAACHIGLLDDSQKEVASSKLDVLIEKLLGLQAEGHKALVFSQFTQLLQIVSDKLSQAAIGHVSLTGKTKHRQEVVERFQTDPRLDVFLVSLKAGGVGLNLIAADYVFILDPWWNPASEAQAIDRAHRIGQQRRVVAYRLLCKGTVEEKVAALQEKKRRLAVELFDESSGLSSGLSQEDLEALVLG